MGLINQAGMYNGVPTLNPLPYVNIAIQARNRKQAREDALDKYYMNLPNTINDKNIRDQEIPIINEGKNKIMEFGVKNREALRNPKIDNGAAKLTLDKMMREVAGVARMSQNAAQIDLTAGKSLMNKDNQFILNSDDYIRAHEAHNLPVTDPNHKTLDLTQFAANRPFNEAAFVKDIKGKIPYSEKIVREVDPADPNYEIVTTLPVLDAKAKEKMAEDAADRFHNDPIFRKKIEKDLAGTGQIPNLLQIAQEQFGVTDPEDMTDELLAAAYTYSKLPIGKTKEKVQANYTNREAGKMDDWRTKFNAANKEWDRRRPLKFADSLALIQAHKKANEMPPDTGYISDEVSDQFGEDLPVKDGETGATITKRFVDIKNVDPERLDIIVGKDLSKKKVGVKPVELNVRNADGTVTKKLGYYVDSNTGDWEGAGKQKASREAAKDRYVNKESSSKFKAQSNTKGSENTKTEQPAKPKAEAVGYSRADLKANGWTDEQINKAVKAGKIKVN